jgi:Papain-like cysteine protease AvrRpt2
MSALQIPYEAQTDPQTNRGCGAASLSMVYKSFGKEIPQAQIWPLIAKPNRFGSVASTTNLMALHAIGQGLSAVVIQARHPIQVLRLCRDAGVRAILNHRLKANLAAGHYSVLLDVDDKDVILHDPYHGAAHRVPHAELIDLWRPSAPVSEIVGNILIGIAENPAALPACVFCHTAIPAQVNCPKCAKPVVLSPPAVLGCIRDGCIARMWNFVCCTACDSLFDETGKSVDPFPAASSTPKSTFPLPPDLDPVLEQIEKFCAKVMSRPRVAENKDVRAQIEFIRAQAEKLKPAQAEELAAIKAFADKLTAFAAASQEKVQANKQRVADLNTPLPPLDGNALGAALLKNLGFK